MATRAALSFTARSEKDLDELSGRLHDFWAQASQVVWDRKTGVVTIPCGPGLPTGPVSEKPPGEHPHRLVLRNVRDLEIEGDREVDDFQITDIEHERFGPDPLCHSLRTVRQQAASALYIRGVPIDLTLLIEDVDADLYGAHPDPIGQWPRGRSADAGR